MLEVATISLILTILIAAAAVLVARRRRAQRNREPVAQDPDNKGFEDIIFNVELPGAQQRGEFYLCCPHCGFSGRLDDLSAVGSAVDCPCCEQPFRVLEPQYSV